MAANAFTVVGKPALRADHVTPFHFATLAAATPEADVKRPAAYSSPPRIKIAFTLLFTPVPIGIQLLPSCRTMFVLSGPPPMLPATKFPPTYNSLLCTARALTVKLPISPNQGIPGRADQVVPSHFAMFKAVSVPTFLLKVPPTNTSLPRV